MKIWKTKLKSPADRHFLAIPCKYDYCLFSKLLRYIHITYFFNDIINPMCHQAFSESLLNVKNVFAILCQTHRHFNRLSKYHAAAILDLCILEPSRGQNRLGSSSYMIQHIKIYKCTHFHAFLTKRTLPPFFVTN